MSDNFEIIAQKELSYAEQILQKAEAQQIKTAEDATSGNGILKDIKAKAKEIEGTRTSFVKPLNDTVKIINDWFKKPLAVLDNAERVLKSGIMAYDNEQRRIVAEEEARLRELARKEEEKQRLALEKKAEKAEAKGNTEKAEELREAAATVQVIAPVLAAPKSTGSYRTDYDFEITDKAMVPEKYKIVDEITIRRVVKAEKELCEIPGIKIITRKVPISR